MSTKSDALEELLALSLEECIAAIAEDVRTKKDRYAGIDAHELANALEVPQPESPSNDWGFTHYAKMQTLEQHANNRDPVSEFVNYLEGKISKERFEELEQKFQQLDSMSTPTFDFLTQAERLILEETMDAEELEGHMSNGICCVASYSVGEGTNELNFEGEVEDDGTCFDLRTPYDIRDGRFIDLSNCVTD